MSRTQPDSGLYLAVLLLTLLLFLPQPPKAYNCPNNEQAWCCIGGGSGACGFACPSGWTCGSRWDSSGQGRDTWWFCVVCKDTDLFCSAITYCIPPISVPTPIPSFQSINTGTTAYIYSGGSPSGGNGQYTSYQWLGCYGSGCSPTASGGNTYCGSTAQSPVYCSFATSSSTTLGDYNFALQVKDSSGDVGTSQSVTVYVSSPPPPICGCNTCWTSGATGCSGCPASCPAQTDSSCSQPYYQRCVSPPPCGCPDTEYVCGDSTQYCIPPCGAGCQLKTIIRCGPGLGSDIACVLNPPPPPPTLMAGAPTPTSPSIDNGQSITLTAHPSGGSGSYTSYQWFSGSSCTTTITGATSSTYTASPTQNTYYCYKVTDSASNSATSPADLVTVNAALVAGAVTPSSPTINNGQSITLYANPSGGTPFYTNYQWFSGSSYSTCTTIISGATSSTVSVSPSTNTYYCYQVGDSSVGTPPQTPTSPADLVTVIPVLVAGPITPASPTIDSGQSVTLTANPSGGTPSYHFQWFSGLSSSTCTTKINGAILSTYPASPTQNTYYCYQVTDSSGPPPQSQTSPSNLVSVTPALIAGPISPSSPTISLGQSITLTANPSGGSGSYTYQWFSGSSCSTAITGATSSTYTVSPTQSTYYCYQVTDSSGPPPQSQTSPSDIVNVNLPPTTILSTQICSSPPVSGIAFKIDPSGLIAVALLALSISFDVLAIGYIISKLVPGTGLDSWIRNEFVEVAKTVVIIAGIFTVLVFLGELSTSLIGVTYATGDLYTNLGNSFGALSNSAENYLYNVYCGTPTSPSIENSDYFLTVTASNFAVLNTLKIGYFLPIPLPFGLPTFFFGPEYRPYVNSLLFTNSFGGQFEALLNDAINLLVLPISMVVLGQYILLPTLAALGLIFLIPAGIIFRAFPLFRGIGGNLIALGIGLSLIYPAILVFFNAPIVNAVSQSVPCTYFNCNFSSSLGFWLNTALSTLFANFGGIALAFSSINGIYTVLNIMILQILSMLLQFLLFILDIIIAWPLTEGLAKMMGGSIRKSLGKHRL